MKIIRSSIDLRNRRGMVVIDGETFRCQLETDWTTEHCGTHPRFCEFAGRSIPNLKFGFCQPWNWILDLSTAETPQGVIVKSQGYHELKGSRIPFQRTIRYFWNTPEMIYEVSECQHVTEVQYTIQGVNPDAMVITPFLDKITHHESDVEVNWQFSPMPVFAKYDMQIKGWVFTFNSSNVEALMQWGIPGNAFPDFQSISNELNEIKVQGKLGDRVLMTTDKHDCIEPDEGPIFPPGDNLTDYLVGDHHSTLSDFAIRKVNSEVVSLGATRLFSLEYLAETPSFPMFKPSLVRSLRSLKERMVFGVIPEDDPGELYQWGTATYPRCLSISALDRFGFHQEAYEYLEFFLDASRQFLPFDQHPHLWDNFYITGPHINERLYDINGHSMKLYEAGKFYLRHREDALGQQLLANHYDTLSGWCYWIEDHMEDDGAVLDETESNIWAYGYGAFTQAPAAAGIKLFIRMAEDAGRFDHSQHYEKVLKKLMYALNHRLWGDAANPYWSLPVNEGNCYQTFIPLHPDQLNWFSQPVRPIGLSCYSLAVPFFLADPEVGLMSLDDPRITETIELAIRYGGDAFDPRMTSWHIEPKRMAHMGYGPGQMLQSLVYTGRVESFRDVLAGLFEVSTREMGDIYLMQEHLGRAGNPNRGNKAALAYFPFLAASLIDLNQIPGRTPFIPDLVVIKTK